MIMDKFTKAIMTVIAISLFMIALNPWIAPTKAYAELDSSDLSLVISNLNDIQFNVHKISNGQCSNRKLC